MFYSSAMIYKNNFKNNYTLWLNNLQEDNC